MKIKTFAILKDYFSPEFEIVENFKLVSDFKAFLIQQNPAAKEILNISRFAVNDTFVKDDFEIKENDTISIIPPSSGG
jgi:molybdopterin synthase sulfur carrier subunit